LNEVTVGAIGPKDSGRLGNVLGADIVWRRQGEVVDRKEKKNMSKTTTVREIEPAPFSGSFSVLLSP